MIDVPKRFKVIVNPKAGKGKAASIYRDYVRPILVAAGCNIVDGGTDDNQTDITHVVTTTRAKEALDIAEHLNVDMYDAILCIGGDGVIHEVINGLARKQDGITALKKIAIGTIPAGTIPSSFSLTVGSGNALSRSLFGECHPSYAAWQAVKCTETNYQSDSQTKQWLQT